MTKKVWMAILGILLIISGGVLIYVFSQSGAQEKYYNFSITVKPAGDFSCVLTPTDFVMVKGEKATITITNTVSGGFDCQIFYSVSGGTKDACTFSKNPVNPGESTILTIDSSKLQSNTTYTGTLIASVYNPVQ